MNTKQIEKGVALILQGMGCDLTESNFEGTPARVAKLYTELLTPQSNNWATFPSPTDGMVVLRGHRVFALCPHHLQVVELKAYVAYVPHKVVLGLSKLARCVEQHLTRPILQEELATLVADTLEETLSPRGVAVVLAGAHGCMRYRGIETDGDVVTPVMRGYFMHSEQTRNEFYRIIGYPGGK